jgi:hypothetical protein
LPVQPPGLLLAAAPRVISATSDRVGPSATEETNMAEKRWESMTTDEKLDELRDGLDRLRHATFDTLARQSDKLDAISASVLKIEKKLGLK